jgi:hypothetical protein
MMQFKSLLMLEKKMNTGKGETENQGKVTLLFTQGNLEIGGAVIMNF